MLSENLTGLGRRAAPSDADKRFLLPRQFAAAGVESRYWIAGKDTPYDQGPTSECVAYSWVGYLTASPIKNAPISFNEIYRRAQEIDEWPGEDYDGTSVRAGAKVLKERGLISEYRWAFRLEEALDHLFAKGPIVLGIDWHWGMLDPDRHGYIAPTGQFVGGHAILGIGGSRTKRNPDGTTGAIRLPNSWGPNWGPQKGRCWLSFEHADQLIRAQGECCVAMEVRK